MASVATEQAVKAAPDTESLLTEKPLTPLPAAEGRALGRTAFRAAERTAEFFDHMRAHYREARRTAVEIVADIRLLMADGSVYDSGVAMIRNVSPSGALLGRVKLCKNAYPVQPFQVEIVMRGGDYEGIVIHAKPVRFECETGGLGVRFEDIIVTA